MVNTIKNINLDDVLLLAQLIATRVRLDVEEYLNGTNFDPSTYVNVKVEAKFDINLEYPQGRPINEVEIQRAVLDVLRGI